MYLHFLASERRYLVFFWLLQDKQICDYSGWLRSFMRVGILFIYGNSSNMSKRVTIFRENEFQRFESL